MITIISSLVNERLLIYYIPLISLYNIFDNNDDIIYTLLYLCIVNITIYTTITYFNDRSLLNYIFVSSISYILISYGLVTSDLTSTLTGCLIKLAIFPFTYYIIPTYLNLSFGNYMYITFTTKFIYLSFILFLPISTLNIYLNNYNLMDYILILNIIIVPFIGYYNYNVITLLIYSSSIQLSYILLTYNRNYIYYFIYTFLSYFLVTMLLYIVIIRQYNHLISSLLLILSMYTYVSLPPFIGFYNKIVTFNSTLMFYDNFILLLLLFGTSILTTYFYINIYNNNLSNIYTTYKYQSLDRVLYTISYIVLYLTLFPLDIILSL